MRWPGRAKPERGSVTVEFALGFLALAAVVVLVLSSFTLAAAKLRVAEATRTAARLASLDVSSQEVTQAARRIAPQVSVSVSVQGEWVLVSVSAPAPHPARWFGLELSSQVWALREAALRPL
ncbi:TadE family type IV pilus minor pilin [Buchananella felis]|uniref:TadE family type IV pilus minor pilin n=1 Tax=Buchananella felis TaxID=3231492 RepID=UPI0035274626